MNPVFDLLPSIIAEAQNARAELALDLATQFARTPDRFDPKALERLGRDGLGLFLTTIGHAAPRNRMAAGGQGRRATARNHHGGRRPPDRGWSHLHRRETPYWLVGVAAGLRTGGLVIMAGIAALILVDHMLPLIQGVLA